MRIPRNMETGFCKSRGHVFLIIVLLALPFLVQHAVADVSFRVTQLEIAVYRDGVAHVRYVVSVNSTTPSISLTLIGEAGNIIVTDEKGGILRYDLTPQNIVIYTLGASRVVFEYDTSTITRKDGQVWTLTLSLPVPGKVILPDESSVVYLSEKPTSIEAKEGRPVLTLIRGTWEISYVIPLKTSTSTTTQTLPVPSPYVITIGATGILVVVLVLALTTYLRRRARFLSEPLSQIDNQILDLIRSRGGRMFESELRDLLAIPKTSAWRHVKKLEKMELLRTRKIGSQNEIELA